ncbi:MAG: hypothetical protein AAF617_12595, partial [Bacteroidota bacterium]
MMIQALQSQLLTCTKKKAICFILLCFPFLMHAQTNYTVSGIIKDAANGETFLGATVLLKGTTIGSTTNEYGFYS